MTSIQELVENVVSDLASLPEVQSLDPAEVRRFWTLLSHQAGTIAGFILDGTWQVKELSSDDPADPEGDALIQVGEGAIYQHPSETNPKDTAPERTGRARKRSDKKSRPKRAGNNKAGSERQVRSYGHQEGKPSGCYGKHGGASTKFKLFGEVSIETDKAWGLNLGQKKLVWLPKSQVPSCQYLYKGMPLEEISLPDWLGKKLGLERAPAS